MAGRKSDAHTEEEMRKVYVDNLKYASARLGEHNITALIEPINTKSLPNYFLDSPDKGKASYSLLVVLLRCFSGF